MGPKIAVFKTLGATSNIIYRKARNMILEHARTVNFASYPSIVDHRPPLGELRCERWNCHSRVKATTYECSRRCTWQRYFTKPVHCHCYAQRESLNCLHLHVRFGGQKGIRRDQSGARFEGQEGLKVGATRGHSRFPRCRDCGFSGPCQACSWKIHFFQSVPRLQSGLNISGS